MFEKEAEEYYESKPVHTYVDSLGFFHDLEGIKQAYIQGRIDERKANEWHYPSKGETLINNNTLENKSSHVQMKAFQTLDEVNKCLKKIPYSDFIDVRILPSDGLYYVIYLES